MWNRIFSIFPCVMVSCQVDETAFALLHQVEMFFFFCVRFYQLRWAPMARAIKRIRWFLEVMTDDCHAEGLFVLHV